MLEFSLIAPLFLALLMGILSFGGYFWRAHLLQQVANDSARAALPGLTAGERQGLAIGAVSTELTALGNLDPRRTTTLVTQTTDIITVQLQYDASQDPLLRLSPVPLAPMLIKRAAVVRLGGL